MTTNDRDRLIRLALSPDDTVHAPADLGDDILMTVLATPQRRRALGFGRFRWSPVLSPTVALVLLVALLAVAALFIVLSSPPRIPPELSMYHGGPEHTGIMPGPGPIGDPVKVWEASRTGAIPFTIMPTVARGRVFVADDSGTLAALDEATGGELWTADMGSPIRSSPVVDGDIVIVGSDGGDVSAFPVGSGRRLWTFHAGGAVSASLVVVDHVVYASSEEGTLYALAGASGTPLWSVAVGGPITRGPAVSNGIIYVGAEGGLFSAIDAATHHVRWTVGLGPGGVGTPTVVDDIIYVGRGLLADESQHDLVALSVGDHRILWRFQAPSRIQVHVGAVGHGFVYAVSEDDNVYALDPITGIPRWTLSTTGSIGTLAALVDDVLYVTSADGTVRAADAGSGEELWKVSVRGVPTMPAVIDGRVIVGTSLGKVVAIGGSGPP